MTQQPSSQPASQPASLHLRGRLAFSRCQSVLPTAAITIPPPTRPDISWHSGGQNGTGASILLPTPHPPHPLVRRSRSTLGALSPVSCVSVSWCQSAPRLFHVSLSPASLSLWHSPSPCYHHQGLTTAAPTMPPFSLEHLACLECSKTEGKKKQRKIQKIKLLRNGRVSARNLYQVIKESCSFLWIILWIILSNP